MKIRLSALAATLLVGITFALPGTASAGLIFQSAILASAQGFGNAPRDLTLQSTGRSVTESGSVGVAAGGGITFGTPISDASVFLGNGISTLSGTADMADPLADNQKYGIPTIGSLGITSANQIGILFNATEPGGDSINVVDLTLKFYTSAGTFLGAIDGQQDFRGTNPGNGVAGFTFVVDSAQQSFVNGLLGVGGAGTTLVLEATLADFAGGPDSFLIYNTNNTGGPGTGGPGTSVPEPGTVALLGMGLLGALFSRRKFKNKA
ncbi:MAG: PEP-CTERM sorting domain-containing protein [Pseudomonadota bacterium]